MTIACPCGAVTLAIRGEPIVCLYCHCDDCQAVHGAAYLPAAMYRREQVSIVTGETFVWRRKTTARVTCQRCGTRLYAEPPGINVRSVSASLLPEGTFRPTFHIQCQHALLPLRDTLPHYAGFPALFGGSDEQVAW
jgi:hypothetical protein